MLIPHVGAHVHAADDEIGQRTFPEPFRPDVGQGEFGAVGGPSFDRDGLVDASELLDANAAGHERLAVGDAVAGGRLHVERRDDENFVEAVSDGVVERRDAGGSGAVVVGEEHAHTDRLSGLGA